MRVGPIHWAWMVAHAAFLNVRFRTRADGHSAFFALNHCAYRGTIVPFGETVLEKVPLSKTHQRKGRQHPKGDTTWVRGIWLGKDPASDDHIIGCYQGRLRARTVRSQDGTR